MSARCNKPDDLNWHLKILVFFNIKFVKLLSVLTDSYLES